MSNFKQNTTTSKAKPKVQVQRKLQTSQHKQQPQTILQRAQQQPESLNHEDVLQLQRTIGNKATTNLLKGGNVVQLGRKWNFLKSRFSMENLFGYSIGSQQSNSSSKKPSYTILSASYRNRRRQEKQEVASFKRNFRTRFGQMKKILKNQTREQLKSSPLATGEKVMMHPLAYAIFKNHLDEEHGTENYAFLDYMTDTKVQHREVRRDLESKDKITTKMRNLTNEDAIQIYDLFIDPKNAPLMTNLSSRTRKTLAANVSEVKGELLKDNPHQVLAQSVSYNMLSALNKAEKEITKLLNDSLIRFKSTDEYVYANIAIHYERELNRMAKIWEVEPDNEMLKASLIPHRQLFWGPKANKS